MHGPTKCVGCICRGRCLKVLIPAISRHPVDSQHSVVISAGHVQLVEGSWVLITVHHHISKAVQTGLVPPVNNHLDRFGRVKLRVRWKGQS